MMVELRDIILSSTYQIALVKVSHNRFVISVMNKLASHCVIFRIFPQKFACSVVILKPIGTDSKSKSFEA